VNYIKSSSFCTAVLPGMPPKVWLIACFNSELGRAIAERVLKSNDIAVIPQGPYSQQLAVNYPTKCTIVDLDTRDRAQCYSAVATTLDIHSKIDVLVNYGTSKLYVGGLEEMEQLHFRDQMELSFYSIVNIIHAVLPAMLGQVEAPKAVEPGGHMINIVDVNGLLGSAALTSSSAALHAVEGYSESLALSVSSSNVKVTIVESPLEVTVGTNPLVFTSDPEYRGYSSSMVDSTKSLLSAINVFPKQAFDDTVNTVLEIAGHKDPPGRIVVGKESCGDVKEYLSAICDDLDDFELEDPNGGRLSQS
jgi:NAD(P)-dependent dehydrogenase (short-subunit alcohol dehydrogenase family)